MIAIIDYGVGNLRSVQKALEFLGYDAVVTNDFTIIKQSDGVILPGVGAFADAMEKLNKDKIDALIYELIQMNKPFLGICLGMQLLFDYSEEGGLIKGLGILPGRIIVIPSKNELKVPHMGWNKLNIKGDNKLLKGIDEESYVYFVHSYYLQSNQKNDVIATTNYGVELEVAVNRGNIFATQFHPEKSGKVGLAILNNFAKLCKEHGGEQ